MRLFRRFLSFCRRHPRKLTALSVGLLVWYYFCLPSVLFDAPCSTVLFDRDGKLLGAKIAADGQWRFPPSDSVPEKFRKAIIAFEDKRFYRHWGVDGLAMGRAIWSNLTQMRRVSGGSTLTMQTIRLSRNGRSRNVYEKLVESVLATRLEWSYSKDQILAMYASNAPFGGNVVGLDAAAWKYFGRSAEQLSWAEAAMLAVLPNSPSLIHLARNRDALKAKRDALLDKLREAGELDSMSCELAKLETLPSAPKPLPDLAPHLLERLHAHWVLPHKTPNGLLYSNIDANLQAQVSELAQRHHEILRGNEVHNLAVLVVDVETNGVLAYVGNVPKLAEEFHGAVDVIPAPRSSGSILKPFLYAAMLSDGETLPATLFPDVPTHFRGYTPKNFDETYSGSAPAYEVVERSLNVPSVYMLHQYGLVKFHHKLKQLGMSTLQKSADHYGLTLVLGGAEATLWDLAGIYAGMARTLKHHREFNGRYAPKTFRPLHLLRSELVPKPRPDQLAALSRDNPLTAAAVWHTFAHMQEVARPGEENFWQNFSSSARVAWKTGTSFGFRDAWAIGVTPRYVVAVWAGNADGEGRPGLIGVKAAAPLLFEVYHLLGNPREWFELPYDDLAKAPICRQSGHRASPLCPETDSLWIPKPGENSPLCPYHQEVFLSADGQYRVHSDCESPQAMRKEVFFVLPPAQEFLYKKRHLLDKPLPPLRDDCKTKQNSGKATLAFIYPPSNDLKIYVPYNLDEQQSKTVFEAAHSNPDAELYWHLDDVFVGSTKQFHQLGINPPIGKHKITIVDAEGETATRRFEILAKTAQ